MKSQKLIITDLGEALKPCVGAILVASQVVPGYQKVFHDPLIAGRIGLEKIKDECCHFSDWINTLKDFKNKKA